MGKIFKIRIGHDNSGIGSGWFLESVDVKHLIMASAPKEKRKEDRKKKKKKKRDEEDEDEEGGEEMQEVVLTYHFPCSRWLACGEEDGELVVELLPEDADELEGETFISPSVIQVFNVNVLLKVKTMSTDFPSSSITLSAPCVLHK